MLLLFLGCLIIGIILSVISSFISKGRTFEGEVLQVSEDSIDFLYDLTYVNEQGEIVYEQEIFDKVFEIIDNAEDFIIIDMFLFGTSKNPVYRNLTQELTDHLMNKKKTNPDIIIYFITDYFNVIWDYKGEHLEELNKTGVNVIFSE